MIHQGLQVVLRVVTRHLLDAAGLKADEGHGGAVALIALSTAAETDMVALMPASYFEHLRASNTLRAFELPVPTEHITISQMWHPRLDRDPAHRWLRGVVLEVCGKNHEH